MHQAILAALARAPSTEDDDEVVDSTQVGAVTLLHARGSTTTATEGAIALNGEEFIASDVAVDVREAR